ncbi:hypothetical protein OF83DRAFT_1126466 [Amylostereum chailletii]|nr:hypothetical protein OF83DRAFT_1126466 [Amylostereum chailletii]
MSSSASSLSNDSFYASELQRALNEQTFGISSFKITQRSSLDATAGVTLLEGDQLEIILFANGYKQVGTDAVYETIDDLLSSLSPSYVVKRHEALVAKLQQLAR